MGCLELATVRAHIEASIIEIVVAEIGKIAKPAKVQLATSLPKTRAGKVMRCILHKVVEVNTNFSLGDNSTLRVPAVVVRL